MSTLRNTLTAATLLLVSSLAALAMQRDPYREVGDGAKPGPPQPQPQVVRDFNVKPDPNGVNSATFSLGYRVTQDKQSQYRLALDAFRTAPDGQDKEAKKAELKKQLTEIFEADMKARKAQADEIETRLKKLQEQYKSREAAKERIIELQIEVLEKDAAGLGFPVAGVSPDLKSVPANKPSANALTPTTTEETSTNISSLSRHGFPRLQRPLSELMKEDYVFIEHLQKLSRFATSTDKKHFAYPNYDPVSDMSLVYLSDAATGKVIDTYDVQGDNLELRFQDGGLAVREDGAKFVVRIPLKSIPSTGFDERMKALVPIADSWEEASRLQPRSLFETLKADPAFVEELKQKELFAVSGDGKYFAIAVVNSAWGLTTCVVKEADSGKSAGSISIKAAATGIRFQEEGLAIREGNGEFVVRLKMTEIERIASGFMDTSDEAGPAPEANSSVRRARSLDELKKMEPMLVEDLSKKGHFAESADGKVFASASTTLTGLGGHSIVYLKDSTNGQLLAKASFDKPIQKLALTDKGVEVTQANGEVRLAIPSSSFTPATSAEPETDKSAPEEVEGALGEYSRIRKAYLSTKAQLVSANEDLKKRLEDAKKANPEASEDQLKAIVQQTANYRDSVESRQREATTILETKLKLLALDVESARASLSVSESELEKSQAVNETKKNAINTIELRRMQLVMEKDKVNLIRAQTILELFQSIKTDGEPKQLDVRSR